jgi:hypothetical protein
MLDTGVDTGASGMCSSCHKEDVEAVGFEGKIWCVLRPTGRCPVLSTYLI